MSLLKCFFNTILSVGKVDRLAGERDIGVFHVTMHELPCTLDKQEDNQETESSALNSVFSPHYGSPSD